MTGRPTRAARARPKATHNTVTLLDLIQAGLVAAPAELTASAAGREFAARLLEDGAVEFAGERHASPSTAAGRALNEANGPHPTAGRSGPPTAGPSGATATPPRVSGGASISCGAGTGMVGRRRFGPVVEEPLAVAHGAILQKSATADNGHIRQETAKSECAGRIWHRGGPPPRRVNDVDRAFPR